MRSNAPSPRLIRNTLAAITAALLGYRFLRAADQSVADLISSAATAASMGGAIIAGAVVRIRKVRARAEAAEMAVTQLRGNLLEGDEDRALWDSVEPATYEHDTCAFGLNVVAINQWRSIPRAG